MTDRTALSETLPSTAFSKFPVDANIRPFSLGLHPHTERAHKVVTWRPGLAVHIRRLADYRNCLNNISGVVGTFAAIGAWTQP